MGITEAAQDEGKLRKTAGQGAEDFMAKWIALMKDWISEAICKTRNASKRFKHPPGKGDKV